MRIDSRLRKLEIYAMAALAATVIAGAAFDISGPSGAHKPTSTSVSAGTPARALGSLSAIPELQPALLEPALRSLDASSQHG